ncbi:unnamed protein product [Hermetia illucens]|uniref:La-related protein 7 n=1 Tax=Hermetia illucens TaxID=343691 RepID=A0A7R8V893_HERIL|nr:la-related protein 7 [Hermetia illucens]CAD7093975.1 unnamed protein product [Hermetia illucens]
MGEVADEENTTPNKPKQSKKARQRKKSYFNAIRKQMEFYFGDANLSKDRFLRKLIEEDPYVPLSTFMTFNKIKKLAKSVEDITKALKNSELLEVNGNLTGVRRRSEIPEVHDADDKTVYVESLPQDVDHDWAIKAFSRFGAVAYVSLPKYKNSNKLKEFGFVEFEAVSSVEKALKAFRAFNGVLCYETTKPEELMSVQSFIKQQELDKSSEAASQDNKTVPDKDAESDCCSSASSDSLQPPAKRIKLSDTETPTSELESEVKPSKKTRKHRKKTKLVDIDRDNVPDITQLRITTKKEWKRLRNKYLNLQREKMAELKRHMSSNRGPKVPRSAPPPRLPVHRSPHNMNFYQDRDKGGDKDADQPNPSHNQTKNEEKQESALPNGAQSSTTRRQAKEQTTLHYESGLIIAVRLLEPCVDVKGFKAEMRQYEQVKYVDVKEGAVDAFLRCDCAVGAQNLVKQIACAEYTCEILSSAREEAYWKKIMQDRADKLEKRVKIPSKRGREKIKQQIPNHIRFDED